jgi:hypothetical protein
MSKVSCPTQNIHKSKETIQVIHETIKGMTYLSMVLFTTLGNISFAGWCLEGNITCPHCFKIMRLVQGFSTKDQGQYPFVTCTKPNLQEMQVVQDLPCCNICDYQKI